MLPINFIYLAAAINLCSAATYAYATLKGHTQPNRITWFMWGLAPLIASAAQFSNHVGLSTLIVLMSGLGPMTIFACTFVNKKAFWETTIFDWLCGILSLAGLILWSQSHNPDHAIAFSILADCSAGIPTLRKAYTHPTSENGPTFLLSLAATSIGFLCVQQITFSAYAFISYLVIVNILMCLTLYRRFLFPKSFRNIRS
jgi:hypothetical protein